MNFRYLTRKNKTANSYMRSQSKTSGFALMIALGIMSISLLVILGLSTLIRVNTNVSNSGKDLAKARQNALFALNLAIGDLQNEMGPDQRISANAAILDEFPDTNDIDGVNNPYWTGSWNSNNPLNGNLVEQVISNKRSSSDGKPSHFRKWLVSIDPKSELSPEDKIEFAKTFSKDSENAVLLVGKGTLGETSSSDKNVHVPRQIINRELEDESGYAYWIGDEGVKTRVAGFRKKEIETNLEQILDVNNANSPRLNAIEGFQDVEDMSEISDRIITFGTAEFAFKDALGGNIDAFKNKFHSISAFSKGLMVDVKNGGIKRDLSLLFASESLPIEFDEQPMFEYDNTQGPFWNYAHRYHNIYKRIQNDGGKNFIKISNFWEDANLDIGDSEIKYTDIPMPVLARMQLIFTLHRQYNTYNGQTREELDNETGGPLPPGPPSPGAPPPGAPPPGAPPSSPGSGGSDSQDDILSQLYRNTLLSSYSPYGGALEIDENTFIIPSDPTPEENAGINVNINDYFYFLNDGEITFNANTDSSGSVTGYFRFTQDNIFNDDLNLVTQNIEIGGTDQNYVIQVPSQGNQLYTGLTFVVLEKDIPFTISDLSVTDTHPDGSNISGIIGLDGSPKYESNDQEILHLMMTPVFYLWNPYNIEIIMDSVSGNYGSVEYFYAPPEIEFTYDNWNTSIKLKETKAFQFGNGDQVGAIWSSNNYNNKAFAQNDLIIPAGEFRYNRVLPAVDSDGFPAYEVMQFFAPFPTAGNYDKLFDYDLFPDVANWLETTDRPAPGYAGGAISGLFTPVTTDTNSRDFKKGNKKVVYEQKRINVDGKEMIIPYDYTPLLFNIRVLDQFFNSNLSLGGGWNKENYNYSLTSIGDHLSDRRMVGALNMDIDARDNFQRRDYHKSELSSSLLVNPHQLGYVLYDTGSGWIWGGTELSPKIAVNIDIRGFSEDDTPGKHALFIDPTNTYYYDDESTDTSLALSPFRIYVKQLDSIIPPRNGNNDSQIEFETYAGDQIYKCISKELPLIPLLSICQLDHAPLGRDSDHFAYYAGRKDVGNFGRPHYEIPSLADSTIRFNGKEARPMAPSFNMAVGNSWAHPTLPLNDISDPDDTYKGFATDRSYLLNETLFDSYFFSGLAYPSGPFTDDMNPMNTVLEQWATNQGTLPNSNYLFKPPTNFSFDQTVKTLSYSNVDPIDLFDKLANFIEIEGAFNVNSTSVESWVAQLSSLRGKAVLYDDSGEGAYALDNTNTENSPVLSQTLPAEKSLENTGGTQEIIVHNSWSHYRSIEDSQIVKLAEELVKQIKARGPFLSLSQFFNREISERYPFNRKGAVQTAIDDSYINLESPKKNVASALRERFDSNIASNEWISNSSFDSPEAFEDDANIGLPGYITQASLMRPFAPKLTARSDTFIIRAYGDVVKKGKVASKAWCEAILQRRIDIIDQSNDQLDPKFEKDDPNAFNRKFEIVSFRWLSANDI